MWFAREVSDVKALGAELDALAAALDQQIQTTRNMASSGGDVFEGGGPIEGAGPIVDVGGIEDG
jgi:hypothetical protein